MCACLVNLVKFYLHDEGYPKRYDDSYTAYKVPHPPLCLPCCALLVALPARVMFYFATASPDLMHLTLRQASYKILSTNFPSL